jgi:excisionase family DNA binding protein
MVTTQEAADILKCDVSHVRRLARDGTLHERALGPRFRLYERAEVEHYATHRPKRGWPAGKKRRSPAGEGD